MPTAILLVLLALSGVAAAQPLWGTPQFPQDRDRSSWWDEAWWAQGRLPTPANFDVQEQRAAYRSGDVEVPVAILRPIGARKPPVVVFLHGRRGLDEVTRLVPRRLAARGFVVVAPDLFSGRFIEPFPVAHDYALEQDAARAIDFALALPDAQGQGKLCVVSHTRGGYYALKALVTSGRQSRAACYVSYYPHWQDPNAGEVAQVYQFAPEVEGLTVPTLVFAGEHEQYQRARAIVAGIEALRAKGRDALLIVYPGVGRGFDFRAPHVRTFADDLAAQDSLRRAAQFIAKHGAAR
ncbi:MAG TPA: dienelactone hydrolase family protein [Burkholderiaceae bacterium]|nr:dienelactone hydrolase family protein [Burkholderiaceae bacterium]